ncbi:MAG: glycoside hydrolase family 127 protein [Kiritimatiellae bacterium]|nr:glycoside hydrolase family 127 protein [Kiritimatiellia bacterium]
MLKVLMIGGLVSLCGIALAAPANREPLAKTPFFRLPLGSVKPTAWLRTQLELQRDGLTGHAEELYEDIGQSDWISDTQRGGQFAWERGPYYAKGLIALAYVLDDPALKARSKKWVDRVLASQKPSGDFGPRPYNWWANMIVLHYLRDVYEVTGDARIPDFMARYFAFQTTALPQHTLAQDSVWAKARGGDNLEIVLWLYELKGDPALLKLADLLVRQTSEWERYYQDGRGDCAYAIHIVNVMQGLKAPPLMYRVTKREAHRQGFANALRPDGWLMRQFGRVDGMFNGTEPLTSRSSTEGTELCAIAERILSSGVALEVLGEGYIGDQLETIAYNVLPATLSPDGKGLRYYTLQNQPKCTNENLGFSCNGNGVNSICPSPNAGYGCCRSNFHFAWPKFVQYMWMATADQGLALTAYGPNTVTARVGAEGRPVTIEETTGYPFRSAVSLKVTDGGGTFPLKLRIPAWCANPSIAVNGEAVKGANPGAFLSIDRTWKVGDRVELSFPMAAKFVHSINDSVAVSRGPLLYSLYIPEKPWKVTKEDAPGGFNTYEILPDKPWNYALLMRTRDGTPVEVSESGAIAAQPFKAANAPVRLKVKGFRTRQGEWGSFNWGGFAARAVEPPASPVVSEGTVEEITLIPFGSTQIRVTLFPWALEQK